jgi:predicted TIM-barrel fold metal-dependent hydrolase
MPTGKEHRALIIDFQHHYIPPKLAERYGARRGEKVVLTEGGIPKFTMHDRVFDLQQQLRDLEVSGIDLAVLSCPLGWDASLEDCQRVNDEYAAVQQEHGNHFAGLAHVPVHEGKTALRELDRAITQLGLRGVTIMSQIKGATLDAPAFREFFAKTVDLDIPIFVHPALMPHGYAHAMDYDLVRIIGRELDLSLAVTRLIAGGVLEAFPALKLVMAHFGGGIAAIKERLINKAYRFGTQLSRSFEEYFGQLYFDMAGFEGGPAALQCALSGIKPERLVFATDYPQDFTGVVTNTGKGSAQIRDYIQSVRDLPLPAAAIESMLGGTAARLLKLGAL